MNYSLEVHVLLLWSCSRTLDLQLSCVLYEVRQTPVTLQQLQSFFWHFLLGSGHRSKLFTNLHLSSFSFHTLPSFFLLISHITFPTTAKMTATAVPWLLPGTPRLAPRCIFQEVKGEQALVCRQAYAL